MKPEYSYPELAAHELEYIKSNIRIEYLYLRSKGRFEEAEALKPYFTFSERSEAVFKAAFGEESFNEAKEKQAQARIAADELKNNH